MSFIRIIDSLKQLHAEEGSLQAGSGKLSGVIAWALAILCFLGVIAFHFPQYLTTPELRQKYSVELLRWVMLIAMLLSGGIGLANLILRRQMWLNGAALALILIAVLLGGHRVPVGDFPDGTPYLGLDWFILDLLGSTLIFLVIEKLFPLYKTQPVFRIEWQTDLVHFMVNHFLVGVILLTVNFLIHRIFGWATYAPLQHAVRSLPFAVELIAIVLVADLAQYWTHRAYHEVPLLWRFHAVHHSTKVLDWMAGSRMHMLELIATRVVVLGVLFLMGFSKTVMDVYIIIVGFQAVFNHANVKLPWGPLKYLIVTPNFHHWHHSSDQAALDRNYAAHFAFIDYVFGTAVKSDRDFPEQYGVLGDYMPQGFARQQLFPFTWKGE